MMLGSRFTLDQYNASNHNDKMVHKFMEMSGLTPRDTTMLTDVNDRHSDSITRDEVVLNKIKEIVNGS